MIYLLDNFDNEKKKKEREKRSKENCTSISTPKRQEIE